MDGVAAGLGEIRSGGERTREGAETREMPYLAMVEFVFADALDGDLLVRPPVEGLVHV